MIRTDSDTQNTPGQPRGCFRISTVRPPAGGCRKKSDSKRGREVMHDEHEGVRMSRWGETRAPRDLQTGVKLPLKPADYRGGLERSF